MKKIVLSPSGSDGDIFPMLTFALALKKRGHEVVVCSLPNAKNLFESNNIEFVEAGLDVKAWSANKNLRHDSLSSFLQQLEFLRADIKLQFEVLLKHTKDAHHIFSGGYNMAAPSIAEFYKIKHHHIFHVPNVFPTNDHPCMMVPWQKMPKPMNQFSWTLNSMNQNLCFKKVVNQKRKELSLSPIKDMWKYMIKDSIMAIDPVLYQIPEEFKKDHAQTGYWYPTINEELPNDLIKFIEQDENVFYFGFGSMPTADKAVIMQIIEQVCANLKLRAIVSKGWADFEINTPNIFLTGKISHQKLFEKIKFAIHHGGPGTVSTAAKAGIPQIIVPHILDQFYWAEKLEQLEVAPPVLNRSNFSPEKLQGTISELLRNSKYFEKAKELKQKLKNSDGMTDFFHPDFQKRWGLDL